MIQLPCNLQCQKLIQLASLLLFLLLCSNRHHPSRCPTSQPDKRRANDDSAAKQLAASLDHHCEVDMVWSSTADYECDVRSEACAGLFAEHHVSDAIYKSTANMFCWRAWCVAQV
jgi:hypothetical protein